MLKPQVSSTRQICPLDGIWNFAVHKEPDLEDDKLWTQTISSQLQVPVPSSYNDIFVDAKIRDHVGWVVYQRDAIVPHTWSLERYCLRFDAATHVARVYVNEHFVLAHSGGYTPFECDITDIVKPGQRFRLTVAVSNELTWESIPPGKIEVMANGDRKQTYYHDFFNYAGLARSVYLYSKPQISIQDIFITTNFQENTGLVDYVIETSHPLEGADVRVRLIDENEQCVYDGRGQKSRAVIGNVRLWQPGGAYLYQLRAELISSSDPNTVIDSYELPIGIRTVEVVGNRFLINGNPFYFTGFGKHEDSLIRGKGHDNATMIHDFHLMDWIGANSFRTAHYPYAEEVYEFADRHGIVVIDETAAVGINLGIIAGVFGFKAPPTFSAESANEKTQHTHLQAIRELVSRDKNHPSVVMWCIANEIASAEAGAREYMEPLVKLTRELDPTRPVCFTNMAFSKVDKEVVTDLFDVLCLNRYYGWYSQMGDLDAAEQILEKELRGWQEAHDKPIIIAEYGADAHAGLHSVLDVAWSEDYQSRFLAMYHRVFDRVDNIVGEHVWNFADFHCTSSMTRVDGNKKGIFTRERRPKAAAQVLRRRWKEDGIAARKATLTNETGMGV
ncbi:hypothetical protein PFICI_13445 [Pestalotiopsis fici W106-1]|uniref:Beta-glucuronidase n=1 Tax=Pestalotiopsis fici (strain W106-1 / CGMCC3.15140) TaxID=1229662 RepID=W3WQ57_PESFW|nr:uncharacterized protein PFICI_13445 [Pestalotiopsis fici W106-1]ETS74961.1 hypothetical protein PFICI_13445 [Pestalotiopsis fici W106-1]